MASVVLSDARLCSSDLRRVGLRLPKLLGLRLETEASLSLGTAAAVTCSRLTSEQIPAASVFGVSGGISGTGTFHYPPQWLVRAHWQHSSKGPFHQPLYTPQRGLFREKELVFPKGDRREPQMATAGVSACNGQKSARGGQLGCGMRHDSVGMGGCGQTLKRLVRSACSGSPVSSSRPLFTFTPASILTPLEAGPLFSPHDISIYFFYYVSETIACCSPPLFKSHLSACTSPTALKAGNIPVASQQQLTVTVGSIA